MQTNQELKSSINELNKAQDRLIDAEKMAALGMLSAEVSHEINTPIGVSITSTTYLSDLLSELKRNIEEQRLSKRSLDDFTANASHSIDLLVNNLNRASELIQSYKQVAVDQTNDKIRKINVKQYLSEIIHSLHPKLKKTNHKVIVNCSNDIEIYCHAGAIAQIITNLVINSIVHGFENMNQGEITINVQEKDHKLYLQYQDNGTGVTAESLEHIFDPFYTTKAGQGGTGLGTHIVQNLVTDTLDGSIEVASEVGEGLSYHIEFPDMQQSSV